VWYRTTRDILPIMNAAVDINAVLRSSLDEITHVVQTSRQDPSLGPVVEEVLYAIDRDWSGDDAVHFTVVTRDPAGRDAYEWSELEPIAEQLYGLVRQHRVDHLPYVRFLLDSERKSVAQSLSRDD